jgi:hypothetical protein
MVPLSGVVLCHLPLHGKRECFCFTQVGLFAKSRVTAAAFAEDEVCFFFVHSFSSASLSLPEAADSMQPGRTDRQIQPQQQLRCWPIGSLRLWLLPLPRTPLISE